MEGNVIVCSTIYSPTTAKDSNFSAAEADENKVSGICLIEM